MKSFLRGLAHAFVSTALTGATVTVASGEPITSGAVLFPSLIAGGLAVIHAAMPSIIGYQPMPQPPKEPPVKFPVSR